MTSIKFRNSRRVLWDGFFMFVVRSNLLLRSTSSEIIPSEFHPQFWIRVQSWRHARRRFLPTKLLWGEILREFKPATRLPRSIKSFWLNHFVLCCVIISMASCLTLIMFACSSGSKKASFSFWEFINSIITNTAFMNTNRNSKLLPQSPDILMKHKKQQMPQHNKYIKISSSPPSSGARKCHLGKHYYHIIMLKYKIFIHVIPSRLFI